MIDITSLTELVIFGLEILTAVWFVTVAPLTATNIYSSYIIEWTRGVY